MPKQYKWFINYIFREKILSAHMITVLISYPPKSVHLSILTDKRNATDFNCSRNLIHLIYFKTNFIILKSDYSSISIIDWNQISPSVSEWKRSTSLYPKYTFHMNQYLVKAPRLLITATHRRRIEAISLLIDTCGIRCHSSIKAARN